MDVDDSQQLLGAIRLTGAEAPIDITLRTPGDLVLAAVQIAHTLINRPSKIKAYIPQVAVSGGRRTIS
jgi:ClpP class serine protease